MHSCLITLDLYTNTLFLLSSTGTDIFATPTPVIDRGSVLMLCFLDS